jgi:hypothetical protein
MVNGIVNGPSLSNHLTRNLYQRPLILMFQPLMKLRWTICPRSGQHHQRSYFLQTVPFPNCRLRALLWKEMLLMNPLPASANRGLLQKQSLHPLLPGIPRHCLPVRARVKYSPLIRIPRRHLPVRVNLK